MPGRLKLPNDNLDVGTFTPAGKYKLTDATYSQLLHKLQGHYTEMPPELRSDILAFYHDLDLPNSTKANAGDWARVLQENSIDCSPWTPTCVLQLPGWNIARIRLPSSRRRRLLVSGNSGQEAIERNGPVDR